VKTSNPPTAPVAQLRLHGSGYASPSAGAYRIAATVH